MRYLLILLVLTACQTADSATCPETDNPRIRGCSKAASTPKEPAAADQKEPSDSPLGNILYSIGLGLGGGGGYLP